MTTSIAVTREWRFAVKRYAPGSTTLALTSSRLLRLIKDAFKGGGTWTNKSGTVSSPSVVWTTRYSCNATTAGSAGDLVDRWSADSDVNWNNAGSAHSWFVLRNTGIVSGGNVELCIDCTNSTSTNLTLVISPAAGFTGGTTTARPTATDETVILSTGAWNDDASGTPCTFHVHIANDGAATRLFITRNSQLRGLWIIDSPQDPLTGWVGPVYGLALSSNSGITVANLSNTARTSGLGPSNTQFTTVLTGEGSTSIGSIITTGTSNEIYSDFDGYDQPIAIGIYSQTYLARGRVGSLRDIWWYNDNNTQGMSYPDDFSRQFVQMGPLLVPWNKSAVVSY